MRNHPPWGHQQHLRLCDVLGREAYHYFEGAEWGEVSQRISIRWETIRRLDEPSWAMVRRRVQRSFELEKAETLLIGDAASR